MCKNFFWLTVGEIVSTQGLKGSVRVNPSSDFPERFLKPGDRWWQKEKENPKKIYLEHGRQIPGKSIFVVSFLGVNNQESAQSLVGQKILVPSTQRPKLSKNEFHLLDLVGLKVKFNDNGQEVGEITNLTNGGNDLLEVRLVSGKKVLIPFVKEIVSEVNLKEKYILINPPKGLLEL